MGDIDQVQNVLVTVVPPESVADDNDAQAMRTRVEQLGLCPLVPDTCVCVRVCPTHVLDTCCACGLPYTRVCALHALCMCRRMCYKCAVCTPATASLRVCPAPSAAGGRQVPGIAPYAPCICGADFAASNLSMGSQCPVTCSHGAARVPVLETGDVIRLQMHCHLTCPRPARAALPACLPSASGQSARDARASGDEQGRVCKRRLIN